MTMTKRKGTRSTTTRTSRPRHRSCFAAAFGSRSTIIAENKAAKEAASVSSSTAICQRPMSSQYDSPSSNLIAAALDIALRALSLILKTTTTAPYSNHPFVSDLAHEYDYYQTSARNWKP